MMQIVIDISKEVYDYILKTKSKPEVLSMDIIQVINAVKNSTPLPKGHGKLIDEKEIDTVVNGTLFSNNAYSPNTLLSVIHNQCIEAVGADSTESECE